MEPKYCCSITEKMLVLQNTLLSTVSTNQQKQYPAPHLYLAYELIDPQATPAPGMGSIVC